MLRLAPACALALGLLLVLAGAGRAAPRELTVFHFNDAHGYIFSRTEKGEVVGGMALMAGALERARAEARARGAQSVLLFAGDMFQGTSVVEATRGACMVELFNRMGMSAACLGNHEFDYGPAVLAKRIGEARYPVLATNLTTRLPLARHLRDRLMLSVGGLKVGLVGCTTTATPGSSFPENVSEFRFLDPVAAVPPAVAKLREEGARVLIAVTHDGVTDDRALARAVPELDLIVGGHSHTALTEPVIEAGRPIVQAGEYTRYLGEVRLSIPEDGRARFLGARLIRLVEPGVPRDAAIQKAVDAYLAPVAEAMAELVGELAIEVPQGVRGGDGPMAALVAEAIREAAGAEIAFANHGGVRRSLPAGPVTMGAVVEAVPFGNTLVTQDLSGAQLRLLLERSVGGEWKSADTRSAEEKKKDVVPLSSGLVPGKRTAGSVQPSGLSMVFDPRRPEGARVLEVRVAGKPLDDGRLYRVASTNYIASGGDGLLELKQGINRKDFPLRDREMVVRYLAKRRPLTALPLGNVVNLANEFASPTAPLTSPSPAH